MSHAPSPALPFSWSLAATLQILQLIEQMNFYLSAVDCIMKVSV
jgi:hypothetical protein